MSRADDSASLASRACGNGVARTQRPLPIVFVGATFSAIPFTLLAFATLSLPASLASVLMATTPLFTALVGAVWLRQRLTLLVGVGLALGRS
jgi:drug/metabolite transporter (DMT)-like permease